MKKEAIFPPTKQKDSFNYVKTKSHFIMIKTEEDMKRFKRPPR